MGEVRYIAVYHDRAAINAAMAGREDDGESHFEYAEQHPTRRMFQRLETAVDFLKDIIATERDFFGQAEVEKHVRVKSRCSACICGGEQIDHRYQVDETGICGEHIEESVCIDD